MTNLHARELSVYALKGGEIEIVHSDDENYELKDGAIELNSVLSLSIEILPNQIVKAKAHILCEFESLKAGCSYTFNTINLKSHKKEEIRKIEFLSGDVWERESNSV